MDATEIMTARLSAAASGDFEPDAYCIRSCGPNGESYSDFRWPLDVGAIVTCPDWLPSPWCGNGLHGLMDGIGDWSLIDDSHDRLWQIVGVLRAEVVEIDGSKVKFPRGKIVYTGSFAGALALIQPEMVKAVLKNAKGNTATGFGGNAAATGIGGNAVATACDGRAAATGIGGNAVATGRNGHAAATGRNGNAAATGIGGYAMTTGFIGNAVTTAPDGRAAATGFGGNAVATGRDGRAAATGRDGHAAATGRDGHAAATGQNAIAASLGANGTATAGRDGWLILAAWDDQFELVTVRAAKVGTEGIRPGIAYRLTVDGVFAEVGA